MWIWYKQTFIISQPMVWDKKKDRTSVLNLQSCNKNNPQVLFAIFCGFLNKIEFHIYETNNID